MATFEKIDQFVFGLGSPIVGLKYFISSSNVRRWMIAPFLFGFLISGMMFGTVVYFLLNMDDPVFFMQQLESQVFSEWAKILITALFFILVLGGTLIAGWVVFRTCMGPFMSKLAETVLKNMGVPTPGAHQFFYMLGVSLIRSLILLAVSLPLLIALLVPGLNLIAGFLLALLFASDIMDFTLEALGYSLAARYEFVRNNIAALVGIALAQGFLATFPGLAILALPFSVAGAADLVVRIHKNQGELARG